MSQVEVSGEVAPQVSPQRSPNGDDVESPALAIATLARPVKFREMGSPATQLDVALVVMPALTAKEQAAAGLAQLIESLQSEALRRALLDANDAAAMRAALAQAQAQRAGAG